MQQLAQGSEFPDTGLTVPGGPRGLPIVVGSAVAQAPHGDQYRARHGDHELMLTFVDPALWSQPDARAWLLRNVARAQQIDHRSLLACYGAIVAGPRALIVQAWPGGFSGRQLLAERSSRGRAVDLATAHVMVGHVCNALAALHEVMVHGYVTLDSVWVSASGRVLLGDAAIGSLLTRTRRFERWRNSGRLPNLAPEQMVAPPQMTPATDVFAVGAMMLELLTGRPLAAAGQPLQALGLWGPVELIDVLERATAAEIGERPGDVQTLKAELGEAVAGLDAVDVRPPGEGRPSYAAIAAITDDDSAVGMVIPPLAGAPTPMPGGGTPMPIAIAGTPAPIPVPIAPTPLPSVPAPMVVPPLPGPPPLPMHGVATAMPPGIPIASGMPAGALPLPPGFQLPAAMPPGGAAMPMALPTSIPGMGPMGVVGVQVTGPDGRPTVVPMLVPLAPTPATAPIAAPASTRARTGSNAPITQAMAELERATRRIADADDADAMQLTEDVSESSTRLAGGELGGASGSSLRLDVADVAEAARRLEALDGTPAAELPRDDDRSAGSGAFFADLDDAPPAAREGSTRARTPVAIDADELEPDAPATYRLLRGGFDDGEHSIGALLELARAGKLDGNDVLVHPATSRRMRVFDVVELRQVLTGTTPPPSRTAPAPTRTPPPPTRPPPPIHRTPVPPSRTAVPPPPPPRAPASTRAPGSLTPPPATLPTRTPSSVTPLPVTVPSRASSDDSIPVPPGIAPPNPGMIRGGPMVTAGPRLELAQPRNVPGASAPMLLATPSGGSALRWILAVIAIAVVVVVSTWIYLRGSP